MKRQILLPAAVFRELRETFKVHSVILSRALKYERNSKRDQALRAAALERGGVVFTGDISSAESNIKCQQQETGTSTTCLTINELTINKL